MPKTVSESLLPYFYKKAQTVLTGYEFDLTNSGTFETKYVANNENVGSYTALAIKRGTISSEDGTVLNEIEIGLDNTDLAFKNYVLGGNLERKQCKINLLFVSSAGSLLGEVLLYHGQMDAPKGDENWVSISLRPFEMLEREYPRRIYQIGCNWRFGDNSCSKHLYDYDALTPLTSQSDGVTLTLSHGQAVDYFVPGFAQIQDGDYINEYRPIASNTTGTVTLRVSFGHTIPNGTSIYLQKLCAKNPDACINIFDNYDNYGGFPHVPKQPII